MGNQVTIDEWTYESKLDEEERAPGERERLMKCLLHPTLCIKGREGSVKPVILMNHSLMDFTHIKNARPETCLMNASGSMCHMRCENWIYFGRDTSEKPKTTYFFNGKRYWRNQWVFYRFLIDSPNLPDLSKEDGIYPQLERGSEIILLPSQPAMELVSFTQDFYFTLTFDLPHSILLNEREIIFQKFFLLNERVEGMKDILYEIMNHLL